MKESEEEMDLSDGNEGDLEEELIIREQLVTMNNLTQKVKRLPEKRIRDESEKSTEDDEFRTVMRKPKKIAKSFSDKSHISYESLLRQKVLEGKIIVCMSSKSNLPKQFGMAKLLRDENIKDIFKIKYKSPSKVLFEFDNRENAEKLINCQKFKELGYRYHLGNEVNLSYGIVRRVDLEMGEEEILENFKSDNEIISVKRLRRQTENSK